MSTILCYAAKQIIDEINSNEEKNHLDNEFRMYFTSIVEDLEAIRATSENENSSDTDTSVAQMLFGNAQSALATANLLNSALMGMPGANIVSNVRNAVTSWVSGKLIPWLNNLWASVWATIQKLVKPTSWKISGGIGGSFLGIAQAQIEVSFG